MFGSCLMSSKAWHPEKLRPGMTQFQAWAAIRQGATVTLGSLRQLVWTDLGRLTFRRSQHGFIANVGKIGQPARRHCPGVFLPESGERCSTPSDVADYVLYYLIVFSPKGCSNLDAGTRSTWMWWTQQQQQQQEEPSWQVLLSDVVWCYFILFFQIALVWFSIPQMGGQTRDVWLSGGQEGAVQGYSCQIPHETMESLSFPARLY